MQQEPFHTEELNTYTINIYQDEDPINPREWCSNLGNLRTFSASNKRNYGLWEDVGDWEDFLRNVGELPPDEEAIYDENDVLALDICLNMEKIKNEAVWFPVKFQDYGSSGCRLYTESRHNDREDEPSGAIIAHLRDIKKEFSVTEISPEIREKVETILEQEIKAMDQYLSGECYGFRILDSSGEDVDSCWGFLGDYGYCLEEARSIVKHLDYQLSLPLAEKGV